MASDDVSRLYLALGGLIRSLRRAVPQATLGHGGLSALSTISANGPLRIGELAVQEGVSAPSMTRILASLESLDYVERTPDPSDGRVALIDLTAAGREYLAGGREQRLAALADRFAALTVEERATLTGALDVLEKLAE